MGTAKKRTDGIGDHYFRLYALDIALDLPEEATKKEVLLREEGKLASEEGDGIQLFRNAVQYIQKSLL